MKDNNRNKLIACNLFSAHVSLNTSAADAADAEAADADAVVM